MGTVFKILLLLFILAALVVGTGLFLDWMGYYSFDQLPFSEVDRSQPTIEGFVSAPPGTKGPTISRTYKWEYRQENTLHIGTTTHPFSMTVDIPQELHDWYKDMERAPVQDYSIYVTSPDDDSFIGGIAEKLETLAAEKGFNSDETLLNFVASFVQCGGAMTYIVEGVEGEYPKYPVETLYDKGGDCEDTSILLASLLRAMGRDVVLVNFPPPSDKEAGHMGIGVVGQLNGSYYINDGKDYYYIETTNNTYRAATLPEDYRNRQATLYELLPIPMLRFYNQYSWEISGNIIRGSREVTLHLNVRNWGTANAQDAYIKASYDGQHWYESAYFDLPTGQQASDIQLELTVPEDYNTLQMKVMRNGVMEDEDEIDLEATS